MFGLIQERMGAEKDDVYPRSPYGVPNCSATG